MSAEVESMMYVREEPWHGLGTKLDQVATAEEALKAAGLDWTVSPRPVWAEVQKDHFDLIPHKQAIMRDTDKLVYAVTSDKYIPIQNTESFKFFDTIVGEGQAIYHTAGSLKQGARIWILAKLPATAAIRNADQVDNYLLLVNGHDGGQAFLMMQTPVRVVCWNTMVKALETTTGPVFQTRHSKDIMRRVQIAKNTLGLSNKMFEDFIEQAERLATQSFLKAELDQFLRQVFDINPAADLAKDHPRLFQHMDRIEQLVETGQGLQHAAIRGTRWAVFNAITEFVDHDKGGDNRDRALNSAWFGPGAQLKQKAWSLLTTNPN